MDLGSLFAGAAQAGSQDIAQRRQSALEYKMRSALIAQQLQGQMEADEAKFGREGVVSNSFSKLLQQKTDPLAPLMPGMMTTGEAGLRAGLIRNETSANARALAGSSRDVDIPSLVETTLKNPELFDTYDARTKARLAPHLSKKGFAYLGKPLTAERENLMNKSMTGLGAIERINGLLSESRGDYLQYFGPGSLGAKKLQAETVLLKDLVEKIQTGAASNSKEDIAYRTLIMPQLSELLEDVADGQFDGDLMRYRLNNIKNMLEPLARNRPTAVTKGQDSVANQFKAGNPVGGGKSDNMGITSDMIAAERKRRAATQVKK